MATLSSLYGLGSIGNGSAGMGQAAQSGLWAQQQATISNASACYDIMRDEMRQFKDIKRYIPLKDYLKLTIREQLQADVDAWLPKLK